MENLTNRRVNCRNQLLCSVCLSLPSLPSGKCYMLTAKWLLGKMATRASPPPLHSNPKGLPRRGGEIKLGPVGAEKFLLALPHLQQINLMEFNLCCERRKCSATLGLRQARLN